jgi:hypothetical protein
MPTVSTSDKYGYDTNPVWEKPVREKEPIEKLSMLIEVEAHSDAHIWFSDGSKNSRRGYEVVIGGWKNKRSEIRRGQQGTQLACEFHIHDPPLQGGWPRKFWFALVRKDDSITIVLGTGWDLWRNRMLMAVDKSVKRIAEIETCHVSTGYGSEGTWEVIVLDDKEKTATKPIKTRTEEIPRTPDSRINIRDTIRVNGTTPSGLLKRPRFTESTPTASASQHLSPEAKRKLSMKLETTLAKHEDRKR